MKIKGKDSENIFLNLIDEELVSSIYTGHSKCNNKQYNKNFKSQWI